MLYFLIDNANHTLQTRYLNARIQLLLEKSYRIYSMLVHVKSERYTFHLIARNKTDTKVSIAFQKRGVQTLH